jgi:transcriptional regulator with XRE-family HTH domain
MALPLDASARATSLVPHKSPHATFVIRMDGVLEMHIMVAARQFDQRRLGQRVADARIEAGLTQADLATAVGLDRTAVAKVEAGARKVSAVELARLAEVLGRPLEWFVTELPDAVVSRRGAPGAQHSLRLDRAVEKVASDVEFLVELGILNRVAIDLRLSSPRDMAGSERAARAGPRRPAP